MEKIIKKLKEESDELIRYGNSHEKLEGCGMRRVIEEWEKQLDLLKVKQ